MTIADNTIYELLDEANCADSCNADTALCELIDELLKDIQHLELECISTRYLLSQYIDEDQGSLLHSDILENLGHCHYDSPAYQLFKEIQYDDGDPMEFRDYLVKVEKVCKGECHVCTNLSLKLRPLWRKLSFFRRHGRR